MISWVQSRLKEQYPGLMDRLGTSVQTNLVLAEYKQEARVMRMNEISAGYHMNYDVYGTLATTGEFLSERVLQFYSETWFKCSLGSYL